MKLLAIVTMFIDHAWATFPNMPDWMQYVGRLAFPIFAYQIAEGYIRTSNIKKYLLRMLIFAVISEVPFNLMMSGSVIYPFDQNVLFTFLIALLAITLIEHIRKNNPRVRAGILEALTILAAFILGYVLMVDYYGAGVLTVIAFYIFHKGRFAWVGQLVCMYVINCVMLAGQFIPLTIGSLDLEIPLQGIAMLSLIPIWLYNGERGPHNKVIQYSFYAFYPAHMLAIVLIALYGHV